METRIPKDSAIVVTDTYDGEPIQYHATLLRYLEANNDHDLLIECRFLDGAIFYYEAEAVRLFVKD